MTAFAMGEVPTLIAAGVRIDDDGVDILDRRVFPFEVRWVRCTTHVHVAEAIEQMVTQSGGPFFAAGAGMVLAGREADRLPPERRLGHVGAAAERLIATRPTNNLIRLVVDAVLPVTAAAATLGSSCGDMAEEAASVEFERYRERSRRLGRHAAALLFDGDTVLTHCWAESYLIETLLAARAQDKEIRVVATETRPYLQGARLTAHSLAEIGVETTLITDGMMAEVMARGMVDICLTAADRVTMDGHVVNKVGTLQLAISARHFGIPYYALVQEPDPEAPDIASVVLEERDGDEVLHALGHRTASPLVTGFYPAFDVTPPGLVAAVVTDRGRFSPDNLASYATGVGTDG